MRVTAIALFGSLFLLPAAPAALAGSNVSVEAAITVTLSAAGEKKAATKKAKKEKVEYMRSAAPPEPKK